jgi:hypothetical protein
MSIASWSSRVCSLTTALVSADSGRDGMVAASDPPAFRPLMGRSRDGVRREVSLSSGRRW